MLLADSEDPILVSCSNDMFPRNSSERSLFDFASALSAPELWNLERTPVRHSMRLSPQARDDGDSVVLELDNGVHVTTVYVDFVISLITTDGTIVTISLSCSHHINTRP